jgi:hypothetical protein
MKKLFIIIATLMVMVSCTTTREANSSKLELRNDKKLAKQEVIKSAVEARRYIIKLDRVYSSHGGIFDLRPRFNYIIIDGEKAIISAAYLGRQYDIRPIAGINMRGKTMNYELTNDLSKGMYKIKLDVTNGENSFEVYLKIGKNGYCSASITNLRIDYVNYSGFIVPIKDKNNPPREDNVI